MGTKRQELLNGCFAKALDDEPMFVLLGRDATAPTRVRDWAMQRKADISMGRKPASDMAMVEEAFETADRMEAWRIEHDGKWRTGLFAGQPEPKPARPDDEAFDGIKRGMLGNGS